jgi:pyruvate/2-oxoglutarate dehydrogenase complex dihydrolipoamide acyltransferase (E2) component
MNEHGLTTATVEAVGGAALESRLQEKHGDRVNKKWQRRLMEALADVNLVHWTQNAPRINRVTGVSTPSTYDLIGRQSSIAGVQLMHEYLVRTVDRLSAEYGGQDKLLFERGATERLIERLRERHARWMLEQQRREKEQAATARHPGAAPSTALVVRYVDHVQREHDLNEDLRAGRPPGTTEQKRLESEQNAARREAEFQRLMAEGIDREVAWDMAHLGWTREKAERYEAAQKAERAARTPAKPKPETEAQARKREQREERERERFWDRERRRSAPKRTEAWQAGRRAGERVGLDQQIGGTGPKQRRLS